MTKKPNYKLRAIFFPVLAIIFIFTCYIIAVSAFGYSFKYENGKIITERKGMILLATRPGDAKVYLDGTLYKSNSPIIYLLSMRISRLDIGEHSIKIEKDGYETWEGVFDVEPGVVSWANYILLVPQKREAVPYNLSGDVVETLTSYDKTRILVATVRKKDNIYSIWDINTGSKEIKRVYEKKITEGESKKIIGFSDSKNRILIEKKIAETKSYSVIEATENGNSWDLGDLYKVSFESYSFNPKNDDEIYVTWNKALYLINYSGKTMSAVLATNVIQVCPDEGNLYFIQNVEGNYGLWRLEQNNTKTNIIKNLPISGSYQVKYLSKLDSYAILPRKSKELFIYTIEKGNPVLKQIADGVDWFNASEKSKYIAIYKGKNLACYEVEKNKFHSTLNGREVANIAWLSDEANIIYREKDKIYLVNFNGYYDTHLFDVSASVPVYVSPSENNYYFGNLNNDKNILDIYSSSL